MADLTSQHASKIRRAERIVTVDHSDCGEASQTLRQFLRGKGTEPAHAHETDFLSLLTHLPDSDLHWGGESSHAHKYHICIVSLVLLEERVAIGAAEDPLELLIGLANHDGRSFHGSVVLTPDFHHPVFIALRGHGNWIVRMKQQITAIVRRQKFVHLLL